jgi:hypothetical protein
MTTFPLLTLSTIIESHYGECGHATYRIFYCYAECHIIIGLYHPLDGITNIKYKLLRFLTIFLQREEGTSF